jgi:hypothetical protein
MRCELQCSEARDLLKKSALLTVFALLFLTSGCNPKPSPDFTLIDDYLKTWDQFAQGENALASRLRTQKQIFEKHLAEALEKNDDRALGRFVFYAVVQVGGFIEVSSPLGRAFKGRIGDAVPIFTDEKGSQRFFAGDLYFWWEANKANHTSFPLYEEWRRREFAQKVAIKMYESAVEKRK